MPDPKPFISHLKWAVPSGLLLAALFSWRSGGDWLRGWLAFSVLLVPGLLILVALWGWAGGGRRLYVVIATALLLRLACGAALTMLLPSIGYDNPEQAHGYLFNDAYRRDTQAWKLASGRSPLIEAFTGEQFVSDQYGALLAASALLYRYLSPDLHRQMLVILLGALVAAMAVPVVWRAGTLLGSVEPSAVPKEGSREGNRVQMEGPALALAAAWILAVYPEGILQASSQMREPFLITFSALMLWGFLAIRWMHAHTGWAWLGAGLLGLLLFSPGVALANLVILAGWVLLESRQRRVSWLLLLGLGGVFLMALVLLSASWSSAASGSGPLSVIANWMQNTLRWNLHVLDRTSGIVQYLFKYLPPALRLPFVAGYGVFQPVLPAALIEPTIPLWRAVGTLRALGWYSLLPLLVYGVIAAFKTADPQRRRLWLWLAAVVWAWILIAALRGGGDQWDNPRYRVILLAWEALVAGYAWTFWLRHRDRWLPRVLALELIFLVAFTLWYAGRYSNLPLLNFGIYVIIVLVVGGMLLAADVLRERGSRRPPP